MYLTIDELPHYLLARGLVSADQIVAGDLRIVEGQGRHRHFRVLRTSACSLFVKQLRQTDSGLQQALQNEARLYRRLSLDARCAALRSSVPELLDYDPHRHVLTLELVPAARSLAQLCRDGDADLDAAGRAAAGLLARLHCLYGNRPVPAADADLPRRPPRLLTLLREAPTADRNGGSACVLALRQHPLLCQALDCLARGWQYDGLIHGDIKGENILLARAGTSQPGPYLVDWEFAAWGDSAWDLAGLFVCALGPTPPSPGGRALAWNATCDGWWEEYRQARWPAGMPAAGFQLRLHRCIGARRLQTVLESWLQNGMPAGVLSDSLRAIELAWRSGEASHPQQREVARP